jgi:alkylation response protein AidB-like acyl-CoA dehydrogenase
MPKIAGTYLALPPIMDLSLTETELAFRDELRRWLGANPPGVAPRDDEEVFAFRRDWDRRLFAGGWAGVHWPAEFGGRGATLVESAIYNEEMARAGAPASANVIGITLTGPTLMAHGSEFQKERFLAPILAGEEIWCQGFSEPGAGSDLAAVATRAKPCDGGWTVTGQKVWTSFAQHAKWCILVTRTGTTEERHRGLTYLLMDMEQEGVQVRPLRQISGIAEFTEVFIDNAFVPDENVVGGVGNGWAVAMTTLSSERAGLVFGKQFQVRALLDQLVRRAAERELDTPATMAAIGDLYARAELVRLIAYRNVTHEIDHGQAGPAGPLTKWMWSEVDQDATEFAVGLLGGEALLEDSTWGYEMLRSRGDTIESGTTEVIKNIIAERVLGLPRLR